MSMFRRLFHKVPPILTPPSTCDYILGAITGTHRCHGIWHHWVFGPGAGEDPNLLELKSEGWCRTEQEAAAAWHTVCAEYNRRRLGGHPRCTVTLIPVSGDRDCTNPAPFLDEHGLPVCAGHRTAAQRKEHWEYPPRVPKVPPLGPLKVDA